MLIILSTIIGVIAAGLGVIFSLPQDIRQELIDSPEKTDEIMDELVKERSSEGEIVGYVIVLIILLTTASYRLLSLFFY